MNKKDPGINPIRDDGSKPATKGDVRNAVDELARATKIGFDELREFVKQQGSDSHALIRQENEQTRDELTALIEEVREDLGGAQRDALNLIKDKQEQHEGRMTALEQRAGLA